MKITRTVRCRSYVEVHTDTDAVYEIDGRKLDAYDLKEGSEAEEALLDKLHEDSRYHRAYQRAAYLLDDREYSCVMLYRKLMQTYRDKPLCQRVIRALSETGALDDARYAEHLAEYLVERKRYGIFRARQEMLHRGLDKALVEEALAELENTAEENIPAVLEKKYGRVLTDPKDYRTREKVIAGMARLGYPYRSVKAALDAYFEEHDETL